MGYAIIGDYTLEPLAYGVYHRGIQLVYIVEIPLDKYVEKDIFQGTGLINLYPGSRCQLMEPLAVQKYSHNLGKRKTIPRTNFFYIYIFYRLCQNQEHIHHQRTRIRPQIYLQFQMWNKGQVTHKRVRNWCNSQPHCPPMSLWGHCWVPLASIQYNLEN